jgi:acetolactate synthase I/III small subunit
MQAEQTVLRLIVRNHPGVMSHLCGLFARRGFNVEGILCVPLDDGACSAVLLLVADDRRNAQIVAQLGKLEDVIEVHPDPGRGAPSTRSRDTSSRQLRDDDLRGGWWLAASPLLDQNGRDSLGGRWRSRASATRGDISSRATGTRRSDSGAGMPDRRPGC